MFDCIAERASLQLRVWKMWHETLFSALAFAQCQIQLSWVAANPFPSLNWQNGKDITSYTPWEVLSTGNLPDVSKRLEFVQWKQRNRWKSLRDINKYISDPRWKSALLSLLTAADPHHYSNIWAALEGTPHCFDGRINGSLPNTVWCIPMQQLKYKWIQQTE